MSLISRVEISNYLTEGLESNHFANWNPMLTGITLRMDNQSSLVNITNGGGKTSMAEIILLTLSRDKSLLQRVREKSAPKGRGYTHARVEFREVDKTSFLEPSLLEIDPENLPGQTRVYGVALNNDVADPPIFYSYSGTLEDSPCYALVDGVLIHIPDDVFAKKTRSIPGCQWNTFRNASEWQAHVGDAISIDVVRRNVIYQNKGSDDKNASFFNFKTRAGESYDAAFFKKVVAPDLMTNLLNTFSEEGETTVEDTLHNSLTQIVSSEREMARKQESLKHRELAIGVELKPVVEAGAAANLAREAMQKSLRSVKKDVALLQHFGAQSSPYAIPGLPRSLDKLMRSPEQDARVRKALKGMVLHREAGIVLVDKTLAELAGVEVKRIGEIADRKRISNVTLNSQVIDFACDFDQFKSGGKTGGHYRKAYNRAGIAALLPLLADTSGATLSGLDAVFELAFDTAQAQIDTNPAALKLYALQSTLKANTERVTILSKEVTDLEKEIEGLSQQIKGRADNEAAWKEFLTIAQHLPLEMQNAPRAAKQWLGDEVSAGNNSLNAMSARKGELKAEWERYQKALEEAGLEGIEGIRSRYRTLTAQKKRLSGDLEKAKGLAANARRQLPELQRAELRAEQQRQSNQLRVNTLHELKSSYTIFQSYFGDVDPRDIESPVTTLKKATQKRDSAKRDLEKASGDFAELVRYKASASRFHEIFGLNCDALTTNPVQAHRKWTDAQNLAQQNLQPLEPLIAALESFRVNHPDLTPEQWIKSTDEHRIALEGQVRDVDAAIEKTQGEIKALDNLAVVDDAAFARAWKVLGEKPQRLYATLQSLEGTTEHRIAALSALTGLLSAPVFDTLEELTAAAKLLEQQDISIPLILKDPLLQAIRANGDISGDLQVLGFFAGRYSRQARVLLDPEYAKAQRELLALRVSELGKTHIRLKGELLEVDFRSDAYRMAIQASDALKTGAESKFATFSQELKAATDALHRLAPQITEDALATLDAQRSYLKKGGAEKQAALESECGTLRNLVSQLEGEFEIAEKRASDESVGAYTYAISYAKQGGDIALQEATDSLAQQTEVAEQAKETLRLHEETITELEEKLSIAEATASAFEEENRPEHIEDIRRVVEFSDREDDISFMHGYARQHADVKNRNQQFIDYQSSVNFDRAAFYCENLDKSEADLSKIVAAKSAELSSKKETVSTLSETNKLVEFAEIPSWLALRKSIHDLAYEIGSQAAASKAAHEEFWSFEEGHAPATAHPLYPEIQNVCDRLRSPSLEETGSLSSLVSEAANNVSAINLQGLLEEFTSLRNRFQTESQAYDAKKTDFCTRAESEASTKTAAFNALELDVIKRASPDQIAELNALFERLNVSLQKDREDAAKAMHAAEAANQEALNQLSSLILVAQENLEALRKVMGRYPNGCFLFSVNLASEALIKEILLELTTGVKQFTAETTANSRAGRRGDEGRIKDYLRETLIDRIFLEPKVKFVHSGIRQGESLVTEKLSTGQKVALEFMWIVRQAEYEIERGMSKLSRQQANRKRQETNRVIFVDGIFSTLSDRHIIREAFNGLGNLGGNFQIIGFLHSPTWTNDSSVFPVYHVGKKLTNSNGERLVKFSENGRSPGTVGFFSSIIRPHANAA